MKFEYQSIDYHPVYGAQPPSDDPRWEIAHSFHDPTRKFVTIFVWRRDVDHTLLPRVPITDIVRSAIIHCGYVVLGKGRPDEVNSVQKFLAVEVKDSQQAGQLISRLHEFLSPDQQTQLEDMEFIEKESGNSYVWFPSCPLK